MLPYFIKSEHNSDARLLANGTHGQVVRCGAPTIPEPHPLMDAIISLGAKGSVCRARSTSTAARRRAWATTSCSRRTAGGSTAVAYRPAQKPARTCAPKSTPRSPASSSRVHARWAWNTSSTAKRFPCAPIAKCCSLRAPLQSPLLMLSGIGPEAHFTRAEADGSAFARWRWPESADHLQLRLIFKVTKQITTNDDLKSNWRKFQMGWKWITRRWPLAIGINHGGMFTKRLARVRHPDIQFLRCPLGRDGRSANHPRSGCTFSVLPVAPESRGEIKLQVHRSAGTTLRCIRTTFTRDRHSFAQIGSVRFARHVGTYARALSSG